jgi:hypothetical protein
MIAPKRQRPRNRKQNAKEPQTRTNPLSLVFVIVVGLNGRSTSPGGSAAPCANSGTRRGGRRGRPDWPWGQAGQRGGPAPSSAPTARPLPFMLPWWRRRRTTWRCWRWRWRRGSRRGHLCCCCCCGWVCGGGVGVGAAVVERFLL